MMEGAQHQSSGRNRGLCNMSGRVGAHTRFLYAYEPLVVGQPYYLFASNLALNSIEVQSKYPITVCVHKLLFRLHLS